MSLQSEQYVLGGALQKPELAKRVVEQVAHHDFRDYSNSAICHALEVLCKKGDPFDEITVFEYLRQHQLEGKIPFGYFGQLRDAFVSDANFDFHLSRVKAASDARKECELIERYRQALSNGGNAEAIADMRNQLKQLWEERNGMVLRLKPISARDLPDVQRVESLWGEVFYPGTITQINSEPGVGKTTLLYNFCVHGAMGNDFLGIPFSKPIKTLYVDLETARWLRRIKLERILGIKDLPENFYFIDSLDFREDFQNLLTLCKREKYDLVVFDTQSRVLAMEEENSNAEANHMLRLMRRLTLETNCAVGLVHHSGKAENSKGVYKGRGASAIAGGVDVIVNLEALDEDTIKLIIGKNRIIGTNPVIYLKKGGEDSFEPYTPPGEASGFELFKAQKTILSLNPEKIWETREIKKVVDYSEPTIERAIRRLVESGKLSREGRGRYKIKISDLDASKHHKHHPYIGDASDANSENGGIPDYL